MYLYDELKKYCASDYYPFHMPGHKRRLGELGEPFSIDITEIEGFDNLHHAEGILLEAQRRAAEFYGSEETHFLVNGSTSGILSAIGACVSRKTALSGSGRSGDSTLVPAGGADGRILMARNSHKAAYHAVFLNRLDAVYLYPKRRGGAEQVPEFRRGNECGILDGEKERRRWENGVNGPILPQDVEACLKKYPDIQAVFITSPTYDGVVSDVKAIGALAHKYGIPLIVDEAHGAHFGMHPIFPQSSVKLGADVVIHSLHKTLPSMTQTALLHVNGKLVDRRKLRKMLGIYQSSSPSYVLMASMDQCIRMLSEQGEELFRVFAEALQNFWAATKRLRILKLIETDDPSKILISAGDSGLSGLELDDILRREYHLEMEMAAGNYVLALTSVGDSPEGFSRLLQALLDLDKKLQAEMRKTGCVCETAGAAEKQIENEICKTIAEAEDSRQVLISLEESAGHISGEYIYLYPPGIPLVVPGERIDTEMLGLLLRYRAQGYSLQGMEDYRMENIRVLDERI